MTEEEMTKLNKGHCPDCGYRGFVLGPRGGMSINIECGNIECRSRFNVSVGYATHHILQAERIARQAEGGFDWYR